MASTELREHKQAIRQFMRDHYTDERLAMLLAHAQSGKLSYFSCCCFVGVATADHTLRSGLGSEKSWVGSEHYDAAYELAGGDEAEHAYSCLDDGWSWTPQYSTPDALRRRILIPIVKAEMRRRDRIRQQQPTANELFCGSAV